MAEETIDAAIKACGLKPKIEKSRTMGLTLDGGHEWSPTMYIRLVQDFGLENEVWSANLTAAAQFALPWVSCVCVDRWLNIWLGHTEIGRTTWAVGVN